MSESEIREVIRRVCERLDLQARARVRRVAVPAAVGAGMILSPGCQRDANAPQDATPQDVIVEAVADGYDDVLGRDVLVYDSPFPDSESIVPYGVFTPDVQDVKDVAVFDPVYTVDPGVQPPYGVGLPDTLETGDPAAETPAEAVTPDVAEMPVDAYGIPVDPGAQPPYGVGLPDTPETAETLPADPGAEAADEIVDPGALPPYMAPGPDSAP